MTTEECVKILRQVKDGDLLTFDKNRRKALNMAIEMMSNSPTQMSGISDLIRRQDAIDAIVNRTVTVDTDDQWLSGHARCELEIIDIINALPSAQPGPLSDAYTKAVWTWLLEYQVKAAELKGRYTPYEVLSWVTNDWRKEHEQSN